MANGSGFDPQQFLDAQTTEVNTRRPPLPVMNPEDKDGAYHAVIKNVEMVTGTIGKGERVGQPWMQAIVQLDVQVPQSVQDAIGIKLEKGTITLTERPMIDLLMGPQGQIMGIDNSTGKNRRQRQYREALDLNKPGDSWSWRKAIGQPIKVKVEHEVYLGEIQERVGSILRP